MRTQPGQSGYRRNSPAAVGGEYEQKIQNAFKEVADALALRQA